MSDYRLKHVLLGRNCLAIVLQKSSYQICVQEEERLVHEGYSIFKNFVSQNSVCYWNHCLVKSVSSLEFRGCLVKPMIIVVGGSDFALEVIRSAWGRRVLRPPTGYLITRLGDISELEMLPIPQTQFAPLSEALCKIVVELNSENIAATASTVASRLQDSFPKMEVPNEEILYKTLGTLIKERKLYHTGKGYFVVRPDTYRQRSLSPLCERQMLMTNEEAIVHLHGDQQRGRSLAVQVDETELVPNQLISSSSTSPEYQNILPPSPDLRVVERKHSLRVFRVKGNAAAREVFTRCNSLREHAARAEQLTDATSGTDTTEIQRCEKQSMFTKLFRRMQSLAEKPNKHVTFSAQFPPIEWLDSEQIHCQSVATQTSVQLRKPHPKPTEKKSLYVESSPYKLPWYQSDISSDKSADNSNTNSLQRRSSPRVQTSDDNKMNITLKPDTFKFSPTHRYSYGAYLNHSKRHYRHRRSSSESPKIEKPKKDRTIPGFSCNSPIYSNLKTSNPKAIINPISFVYKPHPISSPSTNRSTTPEIIPSTSTNLHLNSPQTAKKVDDSSKQTSKLPLLSSISTINRNQEAHQPEKEVVAPFNHILNGAVPKSVALVSRLNNLYKNTKDMNSGNTKPTNNRSQTPNTDCSSSRVELVLQDSKSPEISETYVLPSDSAESNGTCINVTLPLNGSTNSGYAKITKAVKPFKTESTWKEQTQTAEDSTKPNEKVPSTKEIVIDNSVNVEVAVEKIPKPNSGNKSNNISTTVSQTVTEETTVTKSSGNAKVVTVTSITTSLSHGALKDADKSRKEDEEKENADGDEQVNDLNSESKQKPCFIDCSSSCNIVTEVK